MPPKGRDSQKTLDSIRLLKDAGVDGVNIPDGARAQSRMSALATAVLAGSDRIINHESAVVHALDKMNETHIIALLVIAQGERKITKGFFKVRQIGLERVRTPSAGQGCRRHRARPPADRPSA